MNRKERRGDREGKRREGEGGKGGRPGVPLQKHRGGVGFRRAASFSDPRPCGAGAACRLPWCSATDTQTCPCRPLPHTAWAAPPLKLVQVCVQSPTFSFNFLRLTQATQGENSQFLRTNSSLARRLAFLYVFSCIPPDNLER